MRDIYIIGVYSTQFKKWPEKSYKDLTRDAYLGVLQDAGFENGDEIQFAWFGNCFMGFWEQMSIRGQVSFIPLVRESCQSNVVQKPSSPESRGASRFLLI